MRTNNVTVSILLTFNLLAFSTRVIAQTNTWDGSADANWNTAANWSLNLVPTVAHDVVIPNGITGTITVNTAAVCSSFTMNGGATSNIVSISTGNSLTVSNEIDIGAATVNNIQKTLAVNDATLSCSAVSTADMGGFNRSSRITASTGTINVTGNIALGNGGFFSISAVQFTGAGTLNIGGTMSGGRFTASTSTVDYYNVDQTIGTYVYNNLTLSGSGTKNISNLATINGNLTLSGTVSATAGTSLSIGGDFALNTGTTFTAGALTHFIAGDWLNNGGTFNQTGSTINFNGAAQTIGGTQATTFDFLALSGSGTKTFAFATVINGNFSIDTGVVADLGTFTGHTADGLTLGGVSQVAGTWGHSSSAAVNTNDTYFANNTGVLTAASAGANIYYTRQTGNWNANTTWSTITYGNATNNGTFPVAGDIVNLGGGDFTVTVNVASACASIVYVASTAFDVTLSINAGITLDVSENINIPRTAIFSGNVNTLAVGSGTLNAGSINFGSGDWLAENDLTISTGTVTVTGDITSDGLVLAYPDIIFTGAGLLQVGGAFLTSENGNLTPGTGTIEFNGSSAQAIGSFTYNNLTLTGSGAKSASGVLDVNGNLTLASGTSFTAGNYTHTVAGNWINNGATFNNSGSTINFDGAAQNLGGTNATAFDRLSLSGSGTKTFNFSTAISGNFSIDGTAVADLGTITSHTADGLTIGGVSQVAGTWGHSSSAAANTNDTYFANNTGVITAASTGANIYFTRQTGNWNAATTWSTITYGDATNNGTFPIAGDIVNIGGGDFTVTVNVASACENLYFQSGNNFSPTVAINGGITLDVSNEIVIPFTPTLSADVNTLAVGAGTLNADQVLLSSIQFGGSPTFTISTGTANIDGNITAIGDGTSTFTFTDAGLLQIAGAIVGASTITLTASTGTVEYDGTAAQTIVNLDYYNLVLDNSAGTIPEFTLNGNTTVTNALTITNGVVDMNSFIFVLGTSSAGSTLTRTASTTTNWMYNGTFRRFWPASTAVTSASANYYGLFPVGTSNASSYRPVEINSTVNPTGTGSFSVNHTNAITATTLSPVFDDGGTNIEEKHDASFVTSTTATGGTYDVDMTMTDLPAGTLSDIRLAISNGATTVTTVGTHAAATGSASNPTAGRTGVSLTNLVGDWRIATSDNSSTPLPVELLSFSGDYHETFIELIWLTSSEINNDYFELEHSGDGVLFNKIATIAGSGTTNQTQQYNFRDRSFHEGINYYRLKQVDYDGEFETFETIAVNTSSIQQRELIIYPNPVKTTLFIRLNGMTFPDDTNVSIMNYGGHKVFEKQLDQTGQVWTISDLGLYLKPGVYMLSIQSKNTQFQRKLVVIP